MHYNQPMNVLVTGAAGYLGRYVIDALVAAGHRVRATVHGTPLSGAQLKPDHECLPGAEETYVVDVSDPATLPEAVADMDAVVHLAALIRESPGNTFQAANFHGVRNLVEAMRRARVVRLIHVGPLGATDEARVRYAYSRWQGERTVRESGLAWTILRPSVMFGRGFGFLNRMVQSIDLSPPGTVAVPGGGRTRFQPVHAGDVARMITLALPDEDHVEKVHDVGGPERLSYRQILKRVLAVLGSRRILVPVPLALMAPVVPIMARVLPDPPVTSDEFALIGRDNVADPETVEREFGFAPRPMTTTELEYLREARVEDARARRAAREAAARARNRTEQGPYAR